MGEVVIIQINIVGILTDIDEINEIMDITEVFVIEKRMKDLTYSNVSEKNISKIVPTHSKKPNHNSNNGYLSYFTVRGLN